MKVTKKYVYRLTEKTLYDDIVKFIDISRLGIYGFDYRQGGEGLRIIKQYFRLIKEDFKKKKFEECARCYKKLILFLFDSSTGRDKASFGYEDLLAKVSNNFDSLIKNYIISILKVYSGKDLASELCDYIVSLKEYGFDSDKEVLIKELEKGKLNELIEDLLSRVQNTMKDKEDRQDVIYFLMEIFEAMDEEERYLELCDKLKGIFSEKEIEHFKNNFDYGSLLENKKEVGYGKNETGSMRIAKIED